MALRQLARALQRVVPTASRLLNETSTAAESKPYFQQFSRAVGPLLRCV